MNNLCTQAFFPEFCNRKEIIIDDTASFFQLLSINFGSKNQKERIETNFSQKKRELVFKRAAN